jgi:hypothetical protein
VTDRAPVPRVLVAVRPVRPPGLVGLFRRRPSPAEPRLTLGPDFFAVLARAPDGWTRTLDALSNVASAAADADPADEVVFGPLEIRMATTELSRISPFAESPAEQAEFGGFRALIDDTRASTVELVLTRV